MSDNCQHPPVDQLEFVACNTCGVLKIDGVIVDPASSPATRTLFDTAAAAEQLRPCMDFWHALGTAIRCSRCGRRRPPQPDVGVDVCCLTTGNP